MWAERYKFPAQQQALHVVRHPIWTHPATLGRQVEAQTTHASAKAKEVQANPQSNTIAPHLLLRQRTGDSQLKLSLILPFKFRDNN